MVIQKSKTILLSLALTVTVVGLAVWAIAAFLFEPANGSEIQADFGITIGTPYFDDGTLLGREPIEVKTIDPASPLAIAGVESGDCILDNITIGHLHRLLLRSKTENVTIRFVSGGSGEPFSDRPVKTISLGPNAEANTGT